MFGASLVIAALGAMLLAGAAGRLPTVSLVGHDAPVNPGATDPADISAHNSPTIVTDPVRPSNLAVSSRIDTPFFSCSLDVSHNGGATWTQTPVPAPKGEQAKCYAPDVAYSIGGTLYLIFVTLHGNGNTPDAVWLSTSKDDGRHLSQPTRVLGPNAFQVRLAADPVRPGRLYLTWLQAVGNDLGELKFTNTGNPVEAARSDNYGATWSSPVQVSNPTRQRVIAPTPVVAANGAVYVAYLDIGQDKLDYEGEHNGHGGPPYTGPYTLVVARSRDRGSTWAESVAGNVLMPISRFVVFTPQFPSIAVDRTGWVYAAYQNARYRPSDVDLWSLPPGGSTWHGPVRVNDTKIHNRTSQYLPQVAVAPDGRLDVVYYDRRHDPANVMNEVSLQSSFDHGRTFTHAIQLSSRPFSSQIGYGAKEGLPDLGSRLGLISANRWALSAWTDTRAGTPATQKQDIAEAAVAVSEPTGLSSGTRHALRYGALVLGLAGLALLGWWFGPAIGSRRPVGKPPGQSEPDPDVATGAPAPTELPPS
ncbi:MAG: glycoside hydrolase [Actinomycetota bacterium]|nr:glycoside hydrolase [Actinomycetota bacterium]